MKIRQGFVSNSSSSSFISIDMKNKPKKPKLNTDTLVVNSSLGRTEFGWGPERLFGCSIMLIFSYLQVQYTQEKWLQENRLVMLENVIKKVLGVKHIVWEIGDKWDKDGRSYIDHQSSAKEGKNTQMFQNEETLEHFIFSPNSHITLDHDNY